MVLSNLGLELQPLAAPLPVWYLTVDRELWTTAARAIKAEGGRLVSMWGVDRNSGLRARSACAAYAIEQGLVWLDLQLAPSGTDFPDLSGVFSCAARMQRTMADLSGLRADGAMDHRPWLDHGLWDLTGPPLQQGIQTQPGPPARLPAEYPFVRVEGDGVHEIAVGPVHAGIIEPGHFRFSAVGEKVLRLEERFGYVHKGIERRFTELPALEAHRLAGRVSGDSTVSFAWAYCMALECALDCSVPARATWLRALMLERERVANHLGDLGALGNDAALSFGLAQFSRLREDWLRLSGESFGHRLMMDAVVPGGVAPNPSPTVLEGLRQQCDDIEREVRVLKVVYDEHAGLQDRFLTTGRVEPALAEQLGLTGLAGRASGQAFDLRHDHRWAPYDQFEVAVASSRNGDVAARVAVRFEEVFESLRLIRLLCEGMPEGSVRATLQVKHEASRGAGWVEGWRGQILVTLELHADGRIVRCHCHDPSWQNWPVLEHAVIGNIVPDFPLINKSFNLSYSGHDL
ncbi:NADH-quinone oxidoreductase subunit C [Ramlibacter sp. WS9]|uniref:hydrogenase large subunit n=1 Tax=Ramlibacter sp. WS9 TaxID=1882741 RepID=UPI00114316E9|nr:NADH-quinone oxidoreductase subunit C [Ramlibacter sp. WS9]ROZ78364.1 Ni,Fe-hydrogenase III large subunit [Ramlibacter sp. WS9]